VATLKTAVAQARQLALAGLEDARAKLDHDTHFPPVGDQGQLRFCYAEVVYDLDEITALGHYEVCVDQTYRPDPYQIIRLESTGWAGQPSRASYRVQAELDAARQVRGSSTDNPDYWKFIRLTDQVDP
jgi:hypothetical protein